MNLIKIHTNLKKLDVVDLAVEVLEELEDFIADLNRSQMADKGQRSDGSDLSPEYSPITELLKRPKSGTAGITGHVTLFDTGDLHKSIFASVAVDELILDSNDSKVDELTAKYGEFLGLTDESIKKLQDKFNPIFYTKLNKAIYG